MSELYDGTDLAILYGVPLVLVAAAGITGGTFGDFALGGAILLVVFIALGTANNLHRRIEQLENQEEGEQQ